MGLVPDIRDETAPLRAVLLGIASDPGDFGDRNLTMAEHRANSTLPTTEELEREVETFATLLTNRGVDVIRPKSIPATLQIFVRDLCFVIGEKLFLANPKLEDRKREQEALTEVIANLDPRLKVIEPPKDFLLEGGDIVLLAGTVLVGVGAVPGRRRTDPEAVDFLRDNLPDWEIIPTQTRASDDKTSGDSPREHILHLDCAFQPLGTGHAIVFEAGFTSRPDAIFDLVGSDRLIRVTGEQMFELWPNIFSIDPSTVVSAPSFRPLNTLLRSLGIEVLEVPYEAVAKLGGLFRCSTMPIRRD
jgi:N-dimethylarginine dimethylaminohydrolase